MLKHEADAPLPHVLRCGVLAAEQHLPGIDGLEAGDRAQQRGLAGAGRAEQRQQFARLHLEAHVLEGGEGAEALGDVAYLDAHA